MSGEFNWVCSYVALDGGCYSAFCPWIFPASRMSSAQGTRQEFIQIKHLLWMMMLIFWSLSLDASSLSWMLGQTVERIFVNCLILYKNAPWRSSMVCLCGIGIEPNPRWAQRFTQIEKAYHYGVEGQESSGFEKVPAIAPQTSRFSGAMSDSPVPSRQIKNMCGF